jgi:predicted unusual protein kinase regulating ubiquinone biosynthesis (AarF/ABC1/UbiB family)
MPKKKSEKIATSPFERAWSVAKMGLQAGTKAASFAIQEVLSGEQGKAERLQTMLMGQAELLRDELSKLKGSLMKAGQMLALLGEHVVPKEVVDVLNSLQSQADPLPWSEMQAEIKRSIRQGQLDDLEINTSPFAAASIGQVHRARRRTDGQELCVKIQYPGVAHAIDSDLKTLRTILSFTKVIPTMDDLDPIFDEVRSLLKHEVDYEREAKFTTWFRQRLLSDNRYIIPIVFNEHSSGKVLTTSFEPGVEIKDAQILALPLERRNDISKSFLELFFMEFFKFGHVQTDPHFGNYRIRLRNSENEVDRLVLYDFGAVRSYSLKFRRDYRKMFLAALDDDFDSFRTSFINVGIGRESDSSHMQKGFFELYQLVLEPYFRPKDSGVHSTFFDRDGNYDFASSDVHERVGKKIWEIKKLMGLRAIPREFIFMDRKVFGVATALKMLRPNFNARSILQGYLDEELKAEPI